MALPLGLFLGGCVVAIPVVTGIAQGVEYQKKQNEEAANETRMIKFNLLVHCDSKDPIAREEVDHGTVILRHDKAWVVPRDDKGDPLPPDEEKTLEPPMHAFAGFYIQYPDENRCPPERGLVSTISDEPPVLNWVFVDRETFEIRPAPRYSLKVESQPGLSLSEPMSDASLCTASLCDAVHSDAGEVFVPRDIPPCHLRPTSLGKRWTTF